MLKKQFLGFFGSSEPKFKFSFEELRNHYDVLHRNPVINDNNKAQVVETIRSISEFIIWGDQNEVKVFEFFLENNIMIYLHNVLLQRSNRSGDIAKQVLQTLSIIIQNVKSETGIFFLFSNNHINNILEVEFDFDDEEVLGYYVSFLKTISLKLNPRTVQFFFDNKSGQITFPLYINATRFAHHKEGMVRAAVRTLTLSIYCVEDPFVQTFIINPPATNFLHEVSLYLVDQIKVNGSMPQQPHRCK
jgi:protein CLEC16A